MDGDDPADPAVPAGAGSKKGEDLVVLARIRCGGIVPPRDRLCQCRSSCSVSKAFSASRARAAAAAMASWVSKNMRVPSGCSFPFRGWNGKTHVQRGLRCRASPEECTEGPERRQAAHRCALHHGGDPTNRSLYGEPAASPDADPTASGTVLAFWEDRSGRRTGCAQRLPRDSAVLGRRSSSAGRNDPPRTPFLASAPTRPSRAGETRGPGARAGITAGRWAPRRPRRRRAARRRSRPGRARPPSCRGPRTWRRSRRTRPCRPRPGARRRSAP